LWIDEETVFWADVFFLSLYVGTFLRIYFSLLLDGVEWLCEAVLMVVWFIFGNGEVGRLSWWFLSNVDRLVDWGEMKCRCGSEKLDLTLRICDSGSVWWWECVEGSPGLWCTLF
jgi:hypothetical protein